MESWNESEYNPWQLLLHAPDAVIVIDRAGKIIFWNPKAETIFGWPSEEAAGRYLTETIIPPQYRKAHDSGMQRFLATGEARVLNKTIEITALNKSGAEFYVSLTISKTVQKGNTVFIAFLRDITDKKENELALIQTSKELQQSNQELEQFAHVASHDMKEPIRKIQVFADILKTRFGNLIPAEGKLYLEKMQNAANRLNNLVEGVLKYSIVQSNKEPLEAIDLAAILKKIESDLELIILDKKAVIQYGKFPAFEGIPFLIYQLFYNLLNNSLKFSKKTVTSVIEIQGKVISSIDTQVLSPSINDQFVEIEIKDNGIGFDQSDAENIFLPFTRLNSQDRYSGTGLGLALCKSIVEKHQGFLSVIAKKEGGAIFKIIIPQKRVVSPHKQGEEQR